MNPNALIYISLFTNKTSKSATMGIPTGMCSPVSRKGYLLSTHPNLFFSSSYPSPVLLSVCLPPHQKLIQKLIQNLLYVPATTFDATSPTIGGRLEGDRRQVEREGSGEEEEDTT